MAQKLNFHERVQIFAFLSKNLPVDAIAQQLNRHISTIYREISRISAPYSPIKAQNDSVIKAKNSKRKEIFQNKDLKTYVFAKLELYWSPEQISKRLIIDFPQNQKMRTSTETIYKFIYNIKDPHKKKRLIQFLRHRKKHRISRKTKNIKRGKIPNMKSIHERPFEVESREILGHWEGDLIIGKGHKTAIGTLVERSSRYVVIVPLIRNKDSYSTVRGFVNAFQNMPEPLKKTLTYDRGTEMTYHEILTEKTGIEVYFADPHSPWQRGSNENTNGLIRNFFPKGTDFSNYSEEDFHRVQKLLNNRPRKALDFSTPIEFLNYII